MVKKEYSYTSTPPMGLTEPQCLDMGALDLFFTTLISYLSKRTFLYYLNLFLSRNSTVNEKLRSNHLQRHQQANKQINVCVSLLLFTG